MSEKVILVDMDGVLAGFNEGVVALINKNHPEINTNVAFDNFHISKDFPEHEQTVRALSDTVGFFENLPVIDGAQEAWQMLVEAGYAPQICSSPLTSHPNCEQEKRNWLEEHFSAKIAAEALIVKDKTKYSGLALIDDKPGIIGSQPPVWQHILFSQSYNKNFKTEYRLDGWNDERLLNYLKKLGSKALKST